MANNVIDQNAIDTGQRIAASPTNETVSNSLAGVSRAIQEGSKVPAMEQSAQGKLQALYDFDRQLEGNYQSPVAPQAQAMYGQNYVPSGAYLTGANRGATMEAGNISDLFSTISAFKSMEGSALTQALGTIFDFLKIQEDRKTKEEDRKWDEYKFNKQMALEEKKLTSGGTYGERKDIENQKLLDDIAQETRNKTNLDTLMKKYGTKVDPSEILRIYNLNAPSEWGPAKESPEILYQKYGVIKPSGAPGVSTQEEEEVTKNIINLVEKIRDNVKPAELINPLSENGKYWNSQVQLGTQLIAKLIEKNRLSDADRVFYLRQTRPDALDLVNPELYRKKVQGTIDVLKTKLGVQGTDEETDPLGIRGGY